MDVITYLSHSLIQSMLVDETEKITNVLMV